MNYLARCAHCIIGRRHSRSGDRPAPLKSGAADGKLVSDWILLVKNRRVRWWDLAGSFLIYLLPLVGPHGAFTFALALVGSDGVPAAAPCTLAGHVLRPRIPRLYPLRRCADRSARVARASQMNSSHGAKSRRSSATRAATPLHEFRLDQQRQRCTAG
jgi:hypothetical protein